MKFYDELKAEMETIQQQMAEVKKSERTDALTEGRILARTSPTSRRPKKHY